MANCRRKQKKTEWVEGEVEQQHNPNKGLSNPTDLFQIEVSGPGL